MSRGSQPPGVSVVLTCGDAAGWADRVGDAGDHVVPVSAHPGRTEVDPVLSGASRLVVAGSDAALAAVLVRLLRRERLDVPVALLPAPDSEAARVWGLAGDLLALARTGVPRAMPLVRDDRGAVVAGVHRVGPLHGEAYCDEHRVAGGDVTEVAVRPDPDGHGVAVTATGPRRLGGLRAGRSVVVRGRAAQVGCDPAPVLRDGVPADRPVERRSWYPHGTDWLLCR